MTLTKQRLAEMRSQLDMARKSRAHSLMFEVQDGIDFLNAVEKLRDALEEARSGLVTSLDTIDHCIEHKCIPTIAESASTRAYALHTRIVLLEVFGESESGA